MRTLVAAGGTGFSVNLVELLLPSIARSLGTQQMDATAPAIFGR